MPMINFHNYIQNQFLFIYLNNNFFSKFIKWFVAFTRLGLFDSFLYIYTLPKRAAIGIGAGAYYTLYDVGQ